MGHNLLRWVARIDSQGPSKNVLKSSAHGFPFFSRCIRCFVGKDLKVTFGKKGSLRLRNGVLLANEVLLARWLWLFFMEHSTKLLCQRWPTPF